MPYNGAGTFSPYTPGNPVVTGTTISSTVQNNTINDVATGLSTAICKDGQTVVTANIPMANFKFTGLGSATGTGQALVYGQSAGSIAGMTLTGTLLLSGAAINYAQELDVASATTTDIGGAASNQLRITGTTTITSFGTTYTGPRFIRFSGALLLTHNASSLILPGGVSITTAAGDTCLVLPLPASAGWVVESYIKASGQPLVYPVLTTLTNSISGDVALNNTANYFDGPSIAQGTTGTWYATGTVVFVDTSSAASISAKLWDGTTVIASGFFTTPGTGFHGSISLSGPITSPAGNIRISVKDSSTTAGKIEFNASGNSKDSTVSATRTA